MNKEHNYEGGLFNYIVLKEEKEVIFYLHNPYPDCLKIPDIMKQRFPSDYKSIVVNSLDDFKKWGFPEFNGVQCPCCKKKKARFICTDPSKGKRPYEQDTFVLQCPVDICDNYGSTTLHEVIKRIGSQSTLQRWREAR
mgnify:CR=1 FL=1